jgi:hypothetical protein
MAIFNCLKWPEMRAVALELIARMHAGHARSAFAIPVVDFVGVFSPGAGAAERAKVAERGDLQFVADSPDGGTFTLPAGPRVLLDLGREGLAMRIPSRMSGTYALRPEAFRVDFNKGEELEGCKRVLLLVCKRVVSVDVSPTRVDVQLPSRLFDLCVEFE